MWIGPVWLVAGVALAELGLDVSDVLLRYCGYGAVAMGVGRLIFVNLQSSERWEYGSLRLFTVGICCAILYVASRRQVADTPSDPVDHALALTGSFGGHEVIDRGGAVPELRPHFHRRPERDGFLPPSA
jgi:hypothetical protein